jgi:hypothetical protein
MAEILGDSHADWLADLGQLVTEIGYRMCIADTGNAEEGNPPRSRNLIEISDRLAANGRLAAGIHEVGHALVALDPLAPKLTSAEEELIVESVVFSSCQGLTPEFVRR